jgi:Rrf2 family protein
MRISAKTEYACIAMIDLAAAYGSGVPVGISKIAERHGMPSRFLVQILMQLKGAGLVSSTRGAAGGYNMIVEPSSINLGQVMDIIDGNISTDKWECNASDDSPAVKALVKNWTEAEKCKRQILDDLTFADLLRQTKRIDKTKMYTKKK